MKERQLIHMKKILVFLLCVQEGAGAGVLFPDDAPKLGESCSIPGVRRKGICREVNDCPYAQDRYGSEIFTHCGTVPLKIIICCQEIINANDDSNVNLRLRDVSPPHITEFECGFEYKGRRDNPYYMNNLLLHYQEEGLEILDIERDGVFIEFFTFTDGKEIYPAINPAHISYLLATPAGIEVSRYMALLGNQNSEKIEWLCSGILINEYWVLTAAHCMTNQREINIVRLGEYDYNNKTGYGTEIDFLIAQTVIYPQYKPPIAYHDLALLRLTKRVRFSLYKNPICLPWADVGRKQEVGDMLLGSGWGATTPGGPGSSELLNANVTILDNLQCERGYSRLPFYSTIWPSGMTNGDILCLGDDPEEPGGLARDACQGDSGGPVVNYKNKTYTLAGVVSTGQGCGSGADEFPGLYVDIRHPPYLAWIKQVAF